MKTPKCWVSEMPKCFDHCSVNTCIDMRPVEMEMLIERVQQDAFKSGRVNGLTKAVWIVSSRTIPPKNPAYTRAIEESVVFLKAEIERLKRGEDSANVVCHCTPPQEK